MKYLTQMTLAIVASILLISSCKTKDATLSGNKAAADKPVENALLWKIEGKELTAPSYLYGTIHIINGDDFFLPSGTLAAIDETDKMVFEIDMNEMSDMSKMMGIMMQAFMKDNVTLKDLLSDDDYQVVSTHFESIGLPLMMLERIKPMFLSALAYGDMDPAGLQSGSMKSYEMEFFEMANSAKKPVAGLETIEFQMGLFDSIPYKEQADLLVQTIKMSDSSSDEFDEMTKMYKAQNINAMIEMIGEESGGLSEHEDVLVGMRNRNWIPVMGDMMNSQPTFFAVGAGHLAGQQGVIKLLRKAGYKLTPVSNKEIKKG